MSRLNTIRNFDPSRDVDCTTGDWSKDSIKTINTDMLRKALRFLYEVYWPWDGWSWNLKCGIESELQNRGESAHE